MYYYFDASDVIIKKGDGSKDKFTWNGSSYDPPTGVFDVLAEYQSNKFRLTTKHGMKYFFDESSHKKLTKVEDPNGNSITISYSNGLPTSITDPSSRSVTLSWTDNHLTQITDANVTPSRSISYQYDENGNQVQVTDPLGNTVDYGYGAWCNITGITDGRSNTVSITYDVNKAVSGISTTITNKTIVYDTENKQTIVTEEVTSGNQTTTYTFDDNGRLIKLTDPSSQFVTLEYDSDNNITEYTDAKSNITTYTFDTKGNQLTETDAEGTRTYTYESNFNKVASIQDKNGNTT
jgi:YD repeat-containing protein